MSDETFPVLRGLSAEMVRSTQWRKSAVRSGSGRSYRVGNYSYPVRTWNLKVNYMGVAGPGDNDLIALSAFYDRHQGGVESFLFDDGLTTDQVDQTITLAQPGQTRWPILMNYLGFVQPASYVVNEPGLEFYKNGALVNSQSFVEIQRWLYYTGSVSSGDRFSWTGKHKFRCVFSDDSMSFDEFLFHMFSSSGIMIETEKS